MSWKNGAAWESQATGSPHPSSSVHFGDDPLGEVALRAVGRGAHGGDLHAQLGDLHAQLGDLQRRLESGGQQVTRAVQRRGRGRQGAGGNRASRCGQQQPGRLAEPGRR
jgi:hypothetical protein